MLSNGRRHCLIDRVWGETLLDEYALRDLVDSSVPMPVGGGERDAWHPNLPFFWLFVKPWCLVLQKVIRSDPQSRTVLEPDV